MANRAVTENAQAPQAENNDGAANAQADKSAPNDTSNKQIPIAKSLDQEIELPTCEMWRHRYGIDSSMTIESCRLSDQQVDAIIKSGVDVNQWNDFGQTPLMLANSPKAVKALIDAGADVMHSDEFLNSVFDYVSSGESVELLVQAPSYRPMKARITEYNKKADVILAFEKHHMLSNASDDVDFELDDYYDLFKQALKDNYFDGVKHFFENIINIILDKDRNSPVTAEDCASTLNNNPSSVFEFESIINDVFNDEKINQTGVDMKIVDFLIKNGLKIAPCKLKNPLFIQQLAKAGADLQCNDAPVLIDDIPTIEKLLDGVDDNQKNIIVRRLLLNLNSSEIASYLIKNKDKFSVITPEILTYALINSTNDEEASILVSNGATMKKNFDASLINNNVVLGLYLKETKDADAYGARTHHETLLNHAISLNNIEMVKTLLNAKASIKLADDFENGTLFEAVSNNNPEMLKLLIEAGAEIKNSEENDILKEAISNDNLEIVQMLLKAGASLQNSDYWKSINSLEMFKYLLTAGLTIDDETWRSLYWREELDIEGAVFDNDTLMEMAKLLKDALIAKKMTIETEKKDDSQFEDLLEEIDSKIKIMDGEIEKLQFIGNRLKSDIFEACTTLVESDGDDATGHWRRNSNELRNLLAAGENPNKTTNRGQTALMVADYPKAVRVLLAAGADLNAKDGDGNSVLMSHVDTYIHNYDEYLELPQIGIIKILVDAGADLNARNMSGESVLDLFLKDNRNFERTCDTLKLLIKAGADTKANNPKGTSFLMQCIKDEDCASCLNIKV